MTNQEHNRLLSIFFYVQGGLQAFGGILVALIYGGMGVFFATSARDADAASIAGLIIVIGVIVVLLTIAMAGFLIYTARKLQIGAPAGRTLGIVASALSLLNLPLGTALGIYGLWFLTSERGRQFYLGGNEYASFKAPPPESWQ